MMTHNVFLAFTFHERLMSRSICFKGGSNEIPETAAQVEASKVAIDQYNVYMEQYRPFERKFIADVMKPTAVKEGKAAGQVNADIAQKSAIPAGMDPNRLIKNPTIASNKAEVSGRARNEAVQNVQDQRVQGMQAISDIGMGKATDAKLGFEGLATESLRKAVGEKAADIQVSNAIASGVMGVAGAGAAGYSNWKKQPENIEGNTYFPNVGYQKG